ncbi:hypothetical protein [Bradyrhizobium sp. Arg816]|uniref:hypothetical protein n=1 Tax=Bradyrhizobium sp. Arg816 TaxID=2998491 RepID=UPI00249F0D07|nr:hypothetical protein [Bradyrhizobium sp. Arg816]MDI3560282.1 hypothetical protein [Bradyrhizobium sp. Arg816]
MARPSVVQAAATPPLDSPLSHVHRESKKPAQCLDLTYQSRSRGGRGPLPSMTIGSVMRLIALVFYTFGADPDERWLSRLLSDATANA